MFAIVRSRTKSLSLLLTSLPLLPVVPNGLSLLVSPSVRLAPSHPMARAAANRSGKKRIPFMLSLLRRRASSDELRAASAGRISRKRCKWDDLSWLSPSPEVEEKQYLSDG